MAREPNPKTAQQAEEKAVLAKDAWETYHAKKVEVAARTVKLREARLAREAADRAAPKAKKPSKNKRG